MIALDTNVLVRYLVRDNEVQAEAAKALLSSLAPDNRAFICREVIVELVWVLERAYGFSRNQIATTLMELVATDVFLVEEGDDAFRAAFQYLASSADFSDLMILAAADRISARTLYSFDKRAARHNGVTLL